MGIKPCVVVLVTPGLLSLPGGSPRVRGGLSSSSLPSRQLPQTPPTLWPGHGATPHRDHRCVPAEPARCGGAQRQSPTQQSLHIRPGPGHPPGGGKAGQETDRHVWVPGVIPPSSGREVELQHSLFWTTLETKQTLKLSFFDSCILRLIKASFFLFLSLSPSPTLLWCVSSPCCYFGVTEGWKCSISNCQSSLLNDVSIVTLHHLFLYIVHMSFPHLKTCNNEK